jgi:hypothetical protein
MTGSLSCGVTAQLTVPLGMPVLTVTPAARTTHYTFFGGQCMTCTTNAQTRPMLDGRRDDSGRRRQRVLVVLDQAATAGDPISASAIARAAGVDRTLPLPSPRPAGEKSMRCKQIQSLM